MDVELIGRMGHLDTSPKCNLLDNLLSFLFISLFSFCQLANFEREILDNAFVVVVVMDGLVAIFESQHTNFDLFV